MGVAWRASVSQDFTAPSASVVIPSSVQSGDGMLALVSWDNGGGTTMTTPAGWSTAVADQTSSTRTSRLLKKVAASTDAGSTFTATSSSSANVRIVISVDAYSGTDLTSFVDDIQVSTDASPSTSHTAPNAAENFTGDLGVVMWAEQTTTSTPQQWAAPSSLTTRLTEYGSGGGAISHLIADTAPAGTVARLAQPRFNKPSLSNPASITIVDGVNGQYKVVTIASGDANVTLTKSRTSGAAFSPAGSLQHNTVTVGSHITLSNPGPLVNGLWDTNQTSAYRRAFYVNAGASGGVAWIGGIHAGGPTLSEGIQTNTPAEVRIAHCRFDRLIVQDETSQTDNHPDLVQCMRADGGVQISWVAGITDMQGFMIKHETSLGASAYPFYNLDNCLIHGGDYGLILLNIVDRTGPWRFENVCLIPSKKKLQIGGSLLGGLEESVIPNASDSTAPLSLVTNSDGTISFKWPAAEAAGWIVQVGKGVYYDPAIAAKTPAQAIEDWLPAALVGDNYNANLYT